MCPRSSRQPCWWQVGQRLDPPGRQAGMAYGAYAVISWSVGPCAATSYKEAERLGGAGLAVPM